MHVCSRNRIARLVFLLMAGVFLVAGAILYVYLVYSKPVGSGPAGPRVGREAFGKPWTTRKVLLLGIGDSVTAGFGVPAPYSYFNRLAKNPEDEFDEMRGICLSAVLPNLRVRNIAVSGSTSAMHLDRVRDQLKPQDADTFGLVVMTTGGNDIIHNYGRSPPREGAMYGATFQQAQPWISNFEKRLTKLIDFVEKSFRGGCCIFVADIYDPSDGLGDAESAGLPAWPDATAIHRAYNDVIRRCAARHPFVHVMSVYNEFLGHGIHCTQPWRTHYRLHDPHYWYAANLEDPNIRGYDAIRRLFLITIAQHAGELASGKPSGQKAVATKP